jgi:hypothetical protein
MIIAIFIYVKRETVVGAREWQRMVAAEWYPEAGAIVAQQETPGLADVRLLSTRFRLRRLAIRDQISRFRTNFA